MALLQERAQARVKRWCKRPPATRATGRLASPTRSKAKQGHRRPVDQVPGRPHEAASDRRPRWMVTGGRKFLTESGL